MVEDDAAAFEVGEKSEEEGGEESGEGKGDKIGLRSRLRAAVGRVGQSLKPGPLFRTGARRGALVMAAILAVAAGSRIRPGWAPVLDPLVGVLVGLVLAAAVGLAVIGALQLLSRLPRLLTWMGVGALGAAVFALIGFDFPPPVATAVGAALVLVQAVLGGAVVVARSGFWARAPKPRRALLVAAVVLPLALNGYLVYWLTDRGNDDHLVTRDEIRAVEPIAAPDPSGRGPFEVRTLTYGSGTDRRRPEFGEDAEFITESVDATPFVTGSTGWRMKRRHRFWGFDFASFPVNGRVWYPDGAGPFPLVLIVHGNHTMQEYSDPGYGYLGELLASRGFVLVSVDENFFNSSWMGSLEKENDGRGWMLLQHVRVWRDWNERPDSPFYGKVDLGNIGLIGHSRGGEAAAIAGAFNRLRHYPDDATIAFDFQFDIRAIIAIAPSDGQYKPSGRPTPLEDVNYLVLQGGHDADVSVFVGDRQYRRVAFTGDEYWFKASLYAYQANHGQFNSVWGDTDFSWPLSLLLNLEPLLPEADQRRIGEVYMSAFLEATLHGDDRYLPLFRDYRRAAAWLPSDLYVGQFQDSTFQAVADFEEDVDVTTTRMPGGSLTGEGLAIWREEDLPLRVRSTKENGVAVLGWRSSEPGVDRGQEEAPATSASYTIALPAGIWAEGTTPAGEALLVFSLAQIDEDMPDPEDDEEDGVEDNDEASDDDSAEDSDRDDEGKLAPVDLHLELVAGEARVRVPLSRLGGVPPVLRSRFTKLPGESQLYGKGWEATLQTYEVELGEVARDHPAFDLAALETIRFVFDLSEEGVIVVDDIGFASLASP